jgi:hypothetical protein
MNRTSILLTALLGLVVVAGCRQGVSEQEILVNAANDPLHEPRLLLQRYAAGQPLGSEVTSYPHLVAEVRKVDAARADVLERGFADIQKASPSARASKAADVLKKIQPSMR